MTEKNITKIEALPKFGRFASEPAKKKRVAAYARVSTEHDELLSSFEAQKDYYQKMIENRVDWELVKVYADYGISAAGIKRREQFSQMIQDCEDGKIDIVLVKSLSRFARNTVDSLNVIRRLKELGIGIWFEKESIWTLDSKGELIVTKPSWFNYETVIQSFRDFIASYPLDGGNIVNEIIKCTKSSYRSLIKYEIQCRLL